MFHVKQTVKGKGEKVDYNKAIWKAKIVAIQSPTIEVRVKTLDNVMVAWESIKPIVMFRHELDTIKNFVRQQNAVAEIRWNFKGSLQGHYESVG